MSASRLSSTPRFASREEVTVEIQRDANGGVAHLCLEVLRMGTGGDHERGVGVAKVVEADARQLPAADGDE